MPHPVLPMSPNGCNPCLRSAQFLGMTPSRGRITRPCAMKRGVILSPQAKNLVVRERPRRRAEILHGSSQDDTSIECLFRSKGTAA
jgi:hypothetical protein